MTNRNHYKTLLILPFMLIPGAFKGTLAQQTSGTFVKPEKESLNYLLFLPDGYAAEADKKWPLVLFLHGAGESGDQLELVKIHGLPKIVQHKTDFPAIVVSPQCPGAKEGWNRFLLRDLLKELTATLKVDEDRVYVTGLSMGGRGTWDMLAYYPELFAAAVPICGWGDPFLVRRAANVPVWIFHGARDRVVPVICSVEMAEALQRVNGNVRLTVYSEAEHDSWTETYDNPALYEWLFSQARVKR